MLLPSVLIKRSRSRGFCTGTLRWRGTVKRAVHARGVVIVPKCLQLPRQIDCVPEEHAIEIFSANGADQPFDNGCEAGAYGTDLTSSIWSTRRLASQRWNRNSGSWSVLKCCGGAGRQWRD